MVFLIGAAIFLYPYLANRVALYRQAQEILTYEAALDASTEEELEQQRQEAEVYNENLSGDPVHDPFVLNSGYVLPENYRNVLDISGDGVMCYIEIPEVDVNLPVYHGTGENELEKGAGHLEGTALPIGGESRHSILCAHRGLPSAELFSRLDEVEVGDLFYLHVLGETHAYRVDRIEVALPEEINQYLSPEEGKDLITLMTCTPYGVNTHRLLVRGERTAYVPPEEERLPEGKDPGLSGKAAVLCLGAVCIVLLVLGIRFLRKKGNPGKNRRETRQKKRRRQ